MRTLTPDERSSFERDGYVLVRGLVPDEARVDTLVAIDRLLCARHPAFRPSTRASVTADVHQKLKELATRDRSALANVYDAARKVAPFWSLAAGRELLEASGTLLSTEAVGVAFRGCGVRLDLPGEDKWRSPWHQEYHSQMSSARALTAWFGLVPVTAAMGPVELLAGSHKDGLVPVRCDDAMNTRKNYAETFVIPDIEERIARFRRVAFETEACDVLFLDFFTLHQSGVNRDVHRSRVTCQVRYFDMLHPSSVEQAWRGGWQDGGDFRAVHPDMVLG
jgi:ectoine hydroxylase-related dioxygenase (phytanoyl-CoA dioxygenase family)